jgi:hypothetical protein
VTADADVRGTRLVGTMWTRCALGVLRTPTAMPPGRCVDRVGTAAAFRPGWNIVERAAGHCPMVSAPQALVRHLLALA